MAATDFKDYYAVLGVSKTANADEIKQTYRKLARQYHPDMNPGDKVAEARFKEINEAYEVLSDPDKRKKYDQFGQYWKQAGSWSPGSTTADYGGFDFSQYGSFDEFINELLGRFSTGAPGGGRSYNYRPPSGTGGFGGFNDYGGFDPQAGAGNLDLESTLTLTLPEAFHGVQQRLSVGSEIITVRIPAGAKPGSRIRVKGKGQISPYNNQQRGDLYLKIEVQPHSFFQFEGDNLVCEVPIAPDEAALGGAIEVPTPDGTVTMNIPAGIRSGQTLRLRGKGWPKPKDGRGDQLVRVVIVAPKDLSPTEREYYEKLRAARSSDPRSHLKNIRL
ncbi:J domain-containing protein [Oscillatoria sp. FACHB-1407]|uniref:DnaJ C-terminal domain-containing protein n=1 Tax=Oscillatoria sp. FACHB-1407 TaxID=2692847 RepID=UPI001685D532|nr:J domain-containing protein [Oscillatoria sp. FACHB-1407]MBD2462868.1 J domain-containing protein [Oscillatoria sp. FACHB-1407]